MGIIGAGGWGLALARILSIRHEVTVWVYEAPELQALSGERESKTFLPGIRFDPAIRFTGAMEEAAKGKDLVVMVTPSFAYRASALAVAPYLSPETVVVSATKGLEAGTMRRMSEIAAEVLPKKTEIVTLSGPSHAEEVSRLVPTAVVVAGKHPKIAERVRDIFITPPHFRVYSSTDHCGVELGGALKNIIAIAAGVIDGMKLGDNPKAALITRGLAEMVRFGVFMGAKPQTFYGLSGIGDLVVTCDSLHSRNRRVGDLLAQGLDYPRIKSEMKQVAEGVYAAKAVHEFALTHKVSMPITESVYRLLFESGDLKKELSALMSRDPKEE
ncbi:MAG: NAD(P)-dependent glycerol-3-phosphate dehydrogenase [Spirochaetes bacterium]|nr:NAD(P)-dependent glycerol-3-phosphate dehydrogenase [Spirochaetota bacterium]